MSVTEVSDGYKYEIDIHVSTPALGPWEGRSCTCCHNCTMEQCIRQSQREVWLCCWQTHTEFTYFKPAECGIRQESRISCHLNTVSAPLVKFLLLRPSLFPGCLRIYPKLARTQIKNPNRDATGTCPKGSLKNPLQLLGREEVSERDKKTRIHSNICSNTCKPLRLQQKCPL